MRVRPAADDAVLIELGNVSADELHRAAASVRRLRSVLASVPGHSSLYVVTGPPPVVSDILRAIDSPPIEAEEERQTHRIRVGFHHSCGPDLEEFLQRASLTAGELAARVEALPLVARFLGFRGGFAYLDGWPEEWAMPRRPTSRSLVPRGTFAVGGVMAGIYPTESPGGWNLLGRTDADLENAIAAGDLIEIVPLLTPVDPPPVHARASAQLRGVAISNGPLARVVSPPDWRRVLRGESPGGPFDPLAAAVANRAVGNEADATLLECPIAAPRLRILRDGVVAWCQPDLTLDVRRVREGEELEFGPVRGGLRGYLAIGDHLEPAPRVSRASSVEIAVAAGPHSTAIESIDCEVTNQLDRVGIRLWPLEPLRVDAPADLPSCGMQFGTIQLHPDGSLVAMGPDHPVTGGYLQPLTVLKDERWKLGQLRPGDHVTLRAGRNV